MSQEPDQTELLRELIENLDAFREVATETMKILHRRIKVLSTRVWFLFGAVMCLVLLFLIMALLSLRQ